MLDQRHWTEAWAEEIQTEARILRQAGATKPAEVYERFARELIERRTAFEDVDLSTAAAARESGYTQQGLALLRRKGLWSGKRRDLPKRPAPASRGPQLMNAQTPTLVEDIVSRAQSSPRRRRASR